ncbi:unnamed protein product [Mytilus edulis]|uniref:Apple domain-containing protein n=1 Tax=Mytilus edulis TaxID=6550 RepID=A0A8S3S5H4_MYTED|nr:unnamed protein product [Mytilus edulis]
MSVLIFLSKSIFGQVCQSGVSRVIPDKSGERLNGSVYITFHNYGPNSCFDECIRRPRCHSFNYNMDSFHCEINEKPSTEVFVSKSGYEYVIISTARQTSRDPCTSDCAEGEICITLYNGMCTCLVDEKVSVSTALHGTTEHQATTTDDVTTKVQYTHEQLVTAEHQSSTDVTSTEQTTYTTQSGATTEEKTTQSGATTDEKTTQSGATTEAKTTQSSLITESTTNSSSEKVSVSTELHGTTEHQATTTDHVTTKVQDTTEKPVTAEHQSSTDVTSTKQTTYNNMTEKSTDTLSTTTLKSTTA